jgi:hypothetical protein
MASDKLIAQRSVTGQSPGFLKHGSISEDARNNKDTNNATFV